MKHVLWGLSSFLLVTRYQPCHSDSDRSFQSLWGKSCLEYWECLPRRERAGAGAHWDSSRQFSGLSATSDQPSSLPGSSYWDLAWESLGATRWRHSPHFPRPVWPLGCSGPECRRRPPPAGIWVPLHLPWGSDGDHCSRSTPGCDRTRCLSGPGRGSVCWSRFLVSARLHTGLWGWRGPGNTRVPPPASSSQSPEWGRSCPAEIWSDPQRGKWRPGARVLYSHWSRIVEARLSLVERFVCHKEPARASKACYSLVFFYVISIGDFHARKGYMY